MNNFEIFINKLEAHLNSQGITAAHDKDLPYGKQLLLTGDEGSDIARVYFNLKGKITLDTSTVKRLSIKAALESFGGQLSKSKGPKANSDALANDYPIIEPPLIGSDESGKGDLFGAMCVAAVYCDKKTYNDLSQLGVKDSKLLSDSFMASIEPEIVKLCPVEIAALEPRELNEKYKLTPNLSILLGQLHGQALSALSERTGCKTLLSDKFSVSNRIRPYISAKNTSLLEEEKAERNLAVAAASIVARCAFIKNIEKLRRQFDIDIPFGAGTAANTAAKKIYDELGADGLNHAVKAHFKNLEKIMIFRAR